MPPPVGERLLELWSSSEPATASAGPVVRIETYKGVERGQRVQISDPYWPRMVGITFIFLCYCHHVESGVGWIEVYGGPRGHSHVRAFPVHAVIVPN